MALWNYQIGSKDLKKELRNQHCIMQIEAKDNGNT